MTKKIIVNLAVEVHWPDQPDEAVPDEYRDSVLTGAVSAATSLGAGSTMRLTASRAYAINPPPPEPPAAPEEPTP